MRWEGDSSVHAVGSTMLINLGDRVNAGMAGYIVMCRSVVSVAILVQRGISEVL